jgi:hypothetical protein
MGGIFLNYAVEMGSGAVIYVPSFIKIGSGVQELIRGIHRHTHGQQGDLISLLLFFQNKESRLKINSWCRDIACTSIHMIDLDYVTLET